MAELLIRLEIDPVTRRKNVVIDYGSDADALPMEHEEDHRRLVDALIEGGTLRAAELGRVIVRRDGDDPVREAPEETAGVDERAAVPTRDGFVPPGSPTR